MTKLEKHFLERVEVDSCSGCWTWTGGTNSKGYGYIYWDGKHLRAHRVAFCLYKAAIPAGLLICHSCDNRKCVNPDHLFLGTARSNILDAIEKGRIKMRDRTPKKLVDRLKTACNSGIGNRGEYNGSARLNQAQVREIRQLRSEGIKLLDLAQRFGISRTQVHNIVAGKKWRHVISAGG